MAEVTTIYPTIAHPHVVGQDARTPPHTHTCVLVGLASKDNRARSWVGMPEGGRWSEQLLVQSARVGPKEAVLPRARPFCPHVEGGCRCDEKDLSEPLDAGVASVDLLADLRTSLAKLGIRIGFW